MTCICIRKKHGELSAVGLKFELPKILVIWIELAINVWVDSPNIKTKK